MLTLPSFQNMIFKYSLQPTSSPKNYILTVPNHQTCPGLPVKKIHRAFNESHHAMPRKPPA